MPKKRAGIPKYFSFSPERFTGLLVLIPLCGVLLFLEITCIGSFLHSSPGIRFFLLFLGGFFLLVPLFFVAYRIFALIFSYYRLERNDLILKWGLRREMIPMNEIEWIRRPSEMLYEIPWSVFPMPGAYTGVKQTEYYNRIEFMASDVHRMLFVGTSRCIYAISPQNPTRFIEAFNRILQMGVLSEVEWKTVRPADWIADALKNKTARVCTVISINLLTILFLWIGFRFGSRNTISLQFSALGVPQEILPVGNVMILPVLAVAFWLADLMAGVRIYSYPDEKKDAELLWCSGVLIQALFVVAGFIIL